MSFPTKLAPRPLAEFGLMVAAVSWVTVACTQVSEVMAVPIALLSLVGVLLVSGLADLVPTPPSSSLRLDVGHGLSTCAVQLPMIFAAKLSAAGIADQSGQAAVGLLSTHDLLRCCLSVASALAFAAASLVLSHAAQAWCLAKAAPPQSRENARSSLLAEMAPVACSCVVAVAVVKATVSPHLEWCLPVWCTAALAAFFVAGMRFSTVCVWQCFTLGEACLLMQCLTLAVWYCVLISWGLVRPVYAPSAVPLAVLALIVGTVVMSVLVAVLQSTCGKAGHTVPSHAAVSPASAAKDKEADDSESALRVWCQEKTTCSTTTTLPQSAAGAAGAAAARQGGGGAVVEDGAKGSAGDDPSLTFICAFYSVCVGAIMFIAHPWLATMLGAEPFLWVATFIWTEPRCISLFVFWLGTLVVFLVGLSPVLGLPKLELPDVSTLREMIKAGLRTTKGEGEANTTLGNTNNAAGKHSAGHQRPATPSTVAAAAPLPVILVRKLYHLLALLLFAPGIVLQNQLMALGFAAAFSILLQLELHKFTGVPPLMHAGSPLRALFDANTDERDGGALTLTHMYLLLGCALPVWADMAGTASAALAGTGGFQLMWRLSNGVGSCVAPFAGVLIIAIGDAMASVVGKNYGRLRWPGTKKTVEGTAAAAASVLVSTLAIYCIMWHLPTVMRMGVSLDSVWPLMQASELVGVVCATLLVCLLEAFTEQIDNLVLPVFFYSLLLIC